MLVIAAGVRTWLQKTEKLGRPSASAIFSATAVGGVVVSNPMAKKTTSFSGFVRASSSASMVEATMRISAPSARAFSSDCFFDPGTRSMSP
jgi:hypothetical protein